MEGKGDGVRAAMKEEKRADVESARWEVVIFEANARGSPRPRLS